MNDHFAPKENLDPNRVSSYFARADDEETHASALTHLKPTLNSSSGWGFEQPKVGRVLKMFNVNEELRSDEVRREFDRQKSMGSGQKT
jgi:hypothetical protein